MPEELPAVIADGPLDDTVLEFMAGQVSLVPWDTLDTGLTLQIEGLYTYGHPRVDSDRKSTRLNSSH